MSEYYAMEPYSTHTQHAVDAVDAHVVAGTRGTGTQGTEKNAERVRALCGVTVQFNVRQWDRAYRRCSKCERAVAKRRGKP